MSLGHGHGSLSKRQPVSFKTSCFCTGLKHSLPSAFKDGKLVLPKGGMQFFNLADIIAGHYTACKDNDAQLKLYNVPLRMAMTGSGSTSEMPLQLEGVDVADGARANAISLLRDAAQCQSIDKLVCSEPSLVVQKPKQQRAKRESTCVEAHQQADEELGPEQLLDEYDVLCNDNADEEDAVLAGITADDEAAIQKLTSTAVREASKNGSALAQASSATSGKTIDKVVAHLRNTHGNALGLTDDELEEEAVVLVMRSMKKDSSYDDYVEQVAQSLVSATGATSASSAAASASRSDEPGEQVRQPKLHVFQPSGVEAVAAETDTCTSAASEHESSDAGGDSQQNQGARNGYLAKWVSAFQNTAEALLDRGRRCEQPLGHEDEVALLLSVPKPGQTNKPAQTDQYQLLFVKWDDPATRTGRSVRVDNNFRVVYSPPVLFGKTVPSQKFGEQDFCCLINACGAASRKSRGTGGFLREQLPSPVIRFARLVGLHSAWETKDTCQRTCHVKP